MKLTIVCKNGELISQTVADAKEPEAYVKTLLRKAKQDGFLVVGQKAILFDNLTNVAWD